MLAGQYTREQIDSVIADVRRVDQRRIDQLEMDLESARGNARQLEACLNNLRSARNAALCEEPHATVEEEDECEIRSLAERRVHA
jgi:outer membrane murein-binding lipoprotein Lpp